MPAAGTLGVIGVDGATGHGGKRVLDETGFIQGVGMDGHLDIEVFGDREAVVDRGRRRPPVLVQLEADRSRGDLLLQRQWQAGVALAEETEVHREAIRRLQHAVDVPGSGRAGGGVGAGGRPRSAAEHGGDARHQRLFDLLRADEVDVGVDAASGEVVETYNGRAGDWMAAVDGVTAAVLGAWEISPAEDRSDDPVSEHFSSSLDAVRHFVLGKIAERPTCFGEIFSSEIQFGQKKLCFPVVRAQGCELSEPFQTRICAFVRFNFGKGRSKVGMRVHLPRFLEDPHSIFLPALRNVAARGHGCRRDQIR